MPSYIITVRVPVKTDGELESHLPDGYSVYQLLTWQVESKRKLDARQMKRIHKHVSDAIKERQMFKNATVSVTMV